MELELRMNGVVKSLEIAPNEMLLSVLRRENYCGVKQGCDTGECGACTVLVDGVARPSCTMLAAQAGGCTLTTVEGIGTARQLHPLQEAFIEVGAVQCGFCTPGMLLSAYALLKRNPRPSEVDVRNALSGNLCRCSGYVKPVQAVLRAAAILRGEKVAPVETTAPTRDEQATANMSGKLRSVSVNGVASTTGKLSVLATGATGQMAALRNSSSMLSVVGKAARALDAVKLATGRPAFAADEQPRGMLYARVLTSPHAHAVIRSIDVSDAKALPGVHAVLTYKDMPRVAYASVERVSGDEGPHDRYCLDYLMRYVGDRVAVVAAETPEIAERALHLIHVEYEVQAPLLDVRQALAPSAPRVHPESESYGISDAAHNVATRTHIEIGDVGRGFAEAELVVEGEYVLPQTQPAPLENHTVVTYFDENEYLVVRTSTQVPHHVRRVLALLLGLPAQRIRVVQPNIGGDFGVKQEVVLEDLAAILTFTTNRAILLAHTRMDEFSSRVRQEHILRIKTGVKRDGTLIAQQLMLLANTGAYGSHPLTVKADSIAHALSLYPCAHMRFAAEALYTNTPPSGVLLGYGLPEMFFALESQIDEIAHQLNLDALALRRKNWITTSMQLALTQDAKKQGVLVESCGLPQCLQLVEEGVRWREQRGRPGNERIRRGVGIALALHSDTIESTSGVLMKMNEDGSCDVFASVPAQAGFSTLLAQIAAEGIGVALDAIHMHTAETNLVPPCTGTSVATLFYSSGGAVKRGAEQLQRQLLIAAGRMLHVMPEVLKIRVGTIVSPNGQTVTVAQVVTYMLAVESRHIMTTASWKSVQTPATFAAQGVEVEVDRETGVVRVLKIVTAVDVGHVINPTITEAQLQGSAAQALGLATCEELVWHPQGRALTTNFGNYHIPTTTDMPELHTYLVETDDPSGPFGAKTGAEAALSALVPAIANAVSDALGIRMHQLPLTPERVLRAIHTARTKA